MNPLWGGLDRLPLWIKDWDSEDCWAHPLNAFVPKPGWQGGTLGEAAAERSVAKQGHFTCGRLNNMKNKSPTGSAKL